MKIYLANLFLLLTVLSSAQEKGVTPVKKLNSQTNDTYALVVGISDYQDEEIPDLNFAHTDAKAFAGFLQSPAGGSLDEDHLKILINEQATQAQFAAGLDWLWEVVGENDKAIIYFSGHGDVEKKSLTQPGYLLCWDAPSKIYMAGGAFPLSMMQEVISTISIQNKAKVIMVADACRSGKLSGSKVGGAQLTNSNLAKQYANEIKILSCQPDEVSIEGKQWGGGRGAFSYHLLEGLSGMADGDEDLSVNLKEIGRYLEDRVAEEVAPQNQNPVIIGNKTEQVTIVFPEILAQLKEGKKTQVQLFAATESRGIEDDVLAAADSSIVVMYNAFKKSLEEKQFLFAEEGRDKNDYAEFYYKKLSQEPQLKKLHSSMRRNYAATLQDDAQQIMNNWMKTNQDLSKKEKKGRLLEKVFTEKVRAFPACLERASELLGPEHYMYATLQGRKHFFKGYILAHSDRNPNEDLAKEALGEFRKGLYWLPELPMTYLEMAGVFGWNLLEPDSAEVYTQKAIELDPNWISPHISMAWLLQKRFRKYDQVKIYLEKAIKIDSTGFPIWNAWGNYYLSQNNLTEAERTFKKAIEIDSTHNWPIGNLGIIYARTGRLDQAEQQFKKAIQIDSTNATAYLNLGLVYNMTKQLEKAETYYKKAIQIDPLIPTMYTNLGGLYLDAGRFEEAEQIVQKGIQIDSTQSRLYGLLAEIFKSTQQNEAAEMNFKKAIQLNPEWMGHYINLGRFYEGISRFEEAEKLYRQSIEVDSTAFQAYMNLGSCLLSLEQYEESAFNTKKAIQMYPGYSGLHGRLGYAYIYIPGRMKDAKIELDKSLELPPENPITYFYLVDWALKSKKPDQAWKYLELGLEKQPESFEVIESIPELEQLKKDPKWDLLMNKYMSKPNEK